MTTVVILLVLLATLLVTSIALGIAVRDTKAIIGNQQYALLSEVAAYIDSQLVAKQTILATIAESVPEQALHDPAALRRYLNAHGAVRKQFPNLIAFDREGRMAANLRDGHEAEGIRANGRAYFEDTLRARTGLISAPFRSVISGLPVVLVTQPVFDARGEVAYVLAGGIDLVASRLFDQVELMKPGQTGFMFIMTDQGILVSHPDKSRVLQHINTRPGTNLATERALAGFEGWMEALNKDGEAGVYAYKRLHATNWIVGARFPSREAFAPLVTIGLDALAAAAVVMVLAGALAWFSVRRLLRPLEVLRHGIADVKDGKADIAVLELQRDDEIGILSREFRVLMAARAEAEARTQNSELMIRSILEQAPDAFVSSDSAGVITEWNLQAEHTFGWTRQEAIGRTIAELLVPEPMRAMHMQGMRKFATSGTGPIVNSRLRVPAMRRDGQQIPVELSVSAVRIGDGYGATAFLHDITDRIAHEEQLAASEKRARMIADSMPALIGYVDQEERYRFTNQYYRVLLGLDPAAMLGKTMEEVQGAESYALIRDRIAAALAGERVHYERELVAVGQQRHFMIDYIPDIDGDGKVLGFYIMVLDISERKSAELKQADSERRAEAASRAKSEFVANMSHEIRTPMNAVLGIAQLLGKTALSSDQRKYLDMIRASGTALLTILNDILDFSKIEAGRIELAPAPFALSQVLDTLATIMTLNAGAKDLELAIGVEPEVPSGLFGDAMRLQQALINLVANAVKFTERGEVSLLVEQVRRDGDKVVLRFVVRDTGIGIEPEHQARIFSSFSQADASMSRRFGGTGLGLAIARRLVDLMGGELTLDSTPGQGSEFAITVPLEVSHQAGTGRTQPGRLGQLRVLLVDDNRTSADYLSKTIASWKWQADTARSGAEAMDRVRAAAAAGQRYDVVLVDWQMEGMSGLETIIALRELAAGQTPPCVIMVSAYGRDMVAGSAEKGRPDAILLKPVTASSLFDTVQEALANGASPADAAAPAADTAASPIRGARLLLVEDNELNQVVARGMLEPAGATVTVAGNGAVAVDLLRADAGAYDLVLMDVQMPVMDGFEATRIIRAELGLELPILAMTAGVTSDEQAQCLACGMDGLVAKPVDMDQMIATIAEHLPQRVRQWIAQQMAPRIEPSVEPQTGPQVEPQIEPQIAPQVEPQIEPQVEPQIEPQVESQIARQVEPQTGLQVEPRTGPQVEPQIAPQIGPRTEAPTAPAAAAGGAACPAQPPAAAGETGGVFDPADLLRIGSGLPGQRKLLDALVSNMASRIPMELARARKALAAGDHAGVGRLFHGLRGSVGSMGAQRFVVAARALETALREDRHEEAAGLFAAAERELLTTQAAARQWLAHFHGTFGVVEMSQEPVDSAALERFRRQVEEHDPEACELYTQLRPALHGKLALAARHEFDAAMDSLDFPRVLGLINAVQLAA